MSIEEAITHLTDAHNALDNAASAIDDQTDSDWGSVKLVPLQKVIDVILEQLHDIVSQEEQRNDPHERAAARARSNDFEDTNGRDWT